ncbi:DUF6933 domain-containing protein [Methylolobus aquaticus]
MRRIIGVIIRLTQKLGDKIGVRPIQALPRDPNPFADWTGHLFTAHRIQYILLANTASLYSVVFFGRGLTHEGVFLARALGELRATLVGDGFRFIHQRLIVPSTDRIGFSKTNDQRVLGSINELVFQAQCHLQDPAVAPDAVTVRLNGMLLSLIGHVPPREALQALTCPSG